MTHTASSPAPGISPQDLPPTIASLLAQGPLRGPAWPGTAKAIAWIVLLLTALQIGRTAASLPFEQISGTMAGIVGFCFIGLAVIVRAMQTSTVRIDSQGLHQSWITHRSVTWQDIQYAKFVPMLFSKRLIVFRRGGRPLVFQSGTRELQTAFAHIALAYRRQ
ncbi:MAG: hypothetical protein ABN482_09050 [Corticimicrobacter sp.]|uniref:hypothetical protein n=1 Tax=Corticimicrobacter sp. TaxID=2678536 RepID=UPI0032DB5A24